MLGITNLSSVRASNLQDLVYKQGQAVGIDLSTWVAALPARPRVVPVVPCRSPSHSRFALARILLPGGDQGDGVDHV